MTMKTCKACGIDKPLEEYHRQARMKDGHKNVCRTCTNSRRNSERRICQKLIALSGVYTLVAFKNGQIVWTKRVTDRDEAFRYYKAGYGEELAIRVWIDDRKLSYVEADTYFKHHYKTNRIAVQGSENTFDERCAFFDVKGLRGLA